jgi:hypothetical protein
MNQPLRGQCARLDAYDEFLAGAALEAIEAASASPCVKKFFKKISKKRPYTLKYCIGSWAWFAEDVAKGYPIDLYSYQNELTIRDFLKDLMLQLTGNERKLVAALLRPYDEQFMAATLPFGRSIRFADEPPEDFWLFRIPKTVPPELEDGLRSRNYI